LALNTLWYRLQAGQQKRILDLGRASSDNLNFFSQCTGKIHIEDLQSTLTEFDYLSPDRKVPLEAVFKYLLPYRRDTKFDFIFSWDLFNYLEAPHLAGLFRRLGQFCRPGSVLFSMISTKKSIPERPGEFRIIDSETLFYHYTSRILRQCPQYQETDLSRLAAGFTVSNSFLLRNGFKEYLLTYGDL
jgi:hypothetical protein